MAATLQFIGRIRTPYHTLRECPRYVDPNGPPCELLVDPQWREGLSGLSPGQKILVLYWLHEASPGPMMQTSPRSGERKGVFALRSPARPNPIGAAEVTIGEIADGRIVVSGLDCLDGTPLLDIKPVFGHRGSENSRRRG